VAAQATPTATAVLKMIGWPAPADVLVARQFKKRRVHL